ncbi:MAG: SDR family oxidoreductase [Selenomonadaceae bacterium]|nr:SDR family oxidoreductase [Selenomonadaceae bacterium]
MSVTFDFTGKNFVVIGATSGIGKQTALELSYSGANVLAIGRNLERLQSLRESSPTTLMKNPPLIFTEQLDVTKATAEDWAQVLGNFTSTVGKINGGVYTAGIWGLTPLNSFDSTLAKNIFDTSFWGAVNFVQTATRKKFSDGGSSFVLMSSIAGDYSGKSIFAYSAAKAAVQSAVKSFASEIIRNEHRINSVAPALVKTEMMNNEMYAATASEEIISRHLLGLGTAKDVAGMILFLLSDRATWITGQNFFVDGGYIVGSYT